MLDESFTHHLPAHQKIFAESSSSLLFAFVLALVLIYLVFAAQFESFVDPFIILHSAACACRGHCFALVLRKTLNIFSEIGIIIMPIGLRDQECDFDCGICQSAERAGALGDGCGDGCSGVALPSTAIMIMILRPCRRLADSAGSGRGVEE